MDEKQKVVVTDLEMPFSSMITFMVKWTLASIPAFFILFIFFLILTAMFGGCVAGLMR